MTDETKKTVFGRTDKARGSVAGVNGRTRYEKRHLASSDGDKWSIAFDGIRLTDWTLSEDIADRWLRDMKPRKCMRCRAEFNSHDAGNRLCDGCRTAAGQRVLAISTDCGGKVTR